MNDAQTRLWHQLDAFPLDEPESSFPYSRKLARENDWSPAYTLRVIREYRRFVLLAMTAGHPVSPSDAVDQAWHLHLTYTRSYWDGLCRQTLGRPLHHEPSRGGAGETAKFASWYAQTLASYRAIFGEEPPADIWPATAGPAPQRRRVNLARTWTLPKPRHLAWIGAVVSAGLALLLAGGCTVANNGITSLFNLRGPEFLIVFLQIWAVCLLVAFILRHLLSRLPTDALPDGEPVADPYWQACLAGDSRRAAAVAVSTLASLDHIAVSGGTELVLRRKSQPPASLHPVARDLWDALPETASASLKQAEGRTEQTCAPIMADLETKGLLLPPAQRSRARWRPLWVALLPVAIGLVKVAIGISRGKPVGFLVICCILAVIAACAICGRSVRLSRSGQRLLDRLKLRHQELVASAPGNSDLLPFDVALFGTRSLTAYGQGELEQTLRPHYTLLVLGSDNSSGGSSCGSSCGGGDGGGGCGGCGGGD